MVALIWLIFMNTETLSQIEQAKKLAALAALELVEENMVVGLGTGSTVKNFSELVGNRCLEGLSIKAVATSNATTRLALKENIPLISLNRIEQIDIDVDGADQFDKELNLIKGKGGALLREKIVANTSKKLIIVADESKKADQLGNELLPVEVIPLCDQLILRQIESMGYKGSIRLKTNGIPYVTDNQNHIINIELPTGVDLQNLDIQLRSIPGLVETGLFLGMASLVIMSKLDGTVEKFQRSV
jgi:ribose 5-phosphate isomerase A